VWIGGIHPNHMVSSEFFNADDFVMATMTREIKVGLVTAQYVPQGLLPMQIIAVCPQTTNDKYDAYNNALL
jgi:hypothetical protein